jgi:uncharacterized membrane protein YoaK (UPF0700 family)
MTSSGNEFITNKEILPRARQSATTRLLRNIGLGSYLSLTAGMVNSVGFLAFGTFVSHISGHTTRAAIEYSENHFQIASVFLYATLSFIFGAILTTLLLTGKTFENRTKRFSIPIFLEVVALVFVAVLGPDFSNLSQEMPGLHVSILVNVCSFAMGLQNALMRRASGTIVRTTHMTGVATDIGIALGTSFIVFFRSTLSAFSQALPLFSATNEAGEGYLFTNKVRQLYFTAKSIASEFFKVFQYDILLMHLTIFVFFILGTVIGALGFIRFSYNIVYLPVGILFLVGLRELVYNKHYPKIPRNFSR